MRLCDKVIPRSYDLTELTLGNKDETTIARIQPVVGKLEETIRVQGRAMGLGDKW